MKIIHGYFTDKGTVKKINQDSLCILSAVYNSCQMTMAVICDGLGGLSEGEKASAYTVNSLSLWFENTLPELIKKNTGVLDLRKTLDNELHRLHNNLNRYSDVTGNILGTTMTAFLTVSSSSKAISAHIGDTRLYRIYNDRITLSTNDHSVLSEEIRNGKLTEEEAENDPRQNQLTKCMGGGLKNISFDYGILPLEENCTYLLCSDGFRKKLSAEELSSGLRPSVIMSNDDAENKLRILTETCMSRGETDNISALILKLHTEDEEKLA